MVFEELKNKALSLPQLPGVYIMKDCDDTVIYVGKAKKLKNRVSQYFQDTGSHTPKTKQMVSNIDHFDTIIAASEFEALVLECSLIKRHHPKYNILLKDDKGYPYIRLNMKEPYPKLTMVSNVTNDGAEYFGPFGSRGVTKSLLEAIYTALKLPTCSKKLPRDIDKGRPCLNYHMKQCAGWCQDMMGSTEYMHAISQARHLLQGDYKTVAADIRDQMLKAAESLNFELAASLRDRMTSVEALSKKQNLITGSGADTDVIGYAQTDKKACFTVLHFSGGNLIDKDFQLLQAQDTPEVAVSSLIKQYYLSRGFAPKVILLPFQLDDRIIFEELLSQNYKKKISIKVPQRGLNTKLVGLAVQNAQEELSLATNKDERTEAALRLLSKMIAAPILTRIESFDISNLSGTDIVASMVVFQNGKAKRSEYKHFKIKDMDIQDDYASMEQVVRRRFTHYIQQDKGFDILPDLLLIDGGITHAKTAKNVLDEINLNILVLGMVKDDRHRTRALVTPSGEEISIDGQQAVFALIGNIQEETHRFAIGYHRKLRSRRLKYSELDQIPNIGQKRKQLLLKTFKSLNGIRAASITELEQYLPKNAARAVFEHFKRNKEG